MQNAQVGIETADARTKWSTRSNEEGLYVAPLLSPGTYSIAAGMPGFATKLIENLKLEVNAHIHLDLTLTPGTITESVTVNAAGVQVNTVDATVSIVVDRRFVENMPLNGRSFQSLTTLMSGVSVILSAGAGQNGEMSVNGQRTESNCFTVDGVSANTGASVSSSGAPGAGFSGATATSSALGTTQSLISLDALQEFRVSTSTYSGEYGPVSFNSRRAPAPVPRFAIPLPAQRCTGRPQLFNSARPTSSAGEGKTAPMMVVTRSFRNASAELDRGIRRAAHYSTSRIFRDLPPQEQNSIPSKTSSSPSSRTPDDRVIAEPLPDVQSGPSRRRPPIYCRQYQRKRPICRASPSRLQKRS